MDFTPQDALRYESLKKKASSDILGFYVNACRSAHDHPRSIRRLLARTNTLNTPTYLLLNEWISQIAPEIEQVRIAGQAAPLRNTLAKQLRHSSQAASSLAERLTNEKLADLLDSFLTTCYGPQGRARKAAKTLLTLPLEDVTEIRDRFVSYQLYSQVASEAGIVFYDAHAPFLRRSMQKRTQRLHVKRYKKLQAQRLQTILSRQQVLKAKNQALISRIHLLELDTVLVFDAYRQYQKQLGKLKPSSLTAAKKLTIFATSTQKIRETYTDKQPATDKLADLQAALQAIDEVLVEIFDMTDTQRNTLMAHLKEFRDLEREASRITKEQATY